MNKSNFKRTIEELRKNAVFHWPDAIILKSLEGSTLPLLIETQDYFLSVLKVSTKSPTSWKDTLAECAGLSGSLFLKHLMILSDLGGEALNKIPPITKYFPESQMNFEWFGKSYTYKFKEIGSPCSLTNSTLKVDAKNMLEAKELTSKGLDVCMLILFGSQATNDTLPTEIKEKCCIGEYIGQKTLLDEFVKQRYLHVSKQTGGALANSLGHATQVYVRDTLQKSLGRDWLILLDSSLPGVRHKSEGGGTNFDIVVKSPKGKYFGVEVSFQVTTNSTIERKARESITVATSAHQFGHKICYVIDGAGNINIRENAVKTLCEHSDCTVAMSEKEIQHLALYFRTIENE